MKKIILCLLLTTSLFSKDISKENKPVTVKVLLAKLAEQSLIEVKGRFYLYNPKNDALIATHTKSKRAKMTTREKGLYWGELLPDLYEVRIVPAEKNTCILVGGIQYRGCIEVYSIGGTLNIVNEVDAENYLKSVLSKKIQDPLSKETLDAVAITERTNLYYHIQKDAYASWQVEASQESYFGEAVAKQNPMVSAAVERTRDLVLNYRLQPFAAKWGYNHAGKSVSYTSIYRRGGNAPSGVDHLPSLAMREESAWRSTLHEKTLTQLVGLNKIKEIDLFRAEKSDKVYALRFIGEKGCKDISFFTFQNMVGEKNLPSNDFTVVFKGKKAYFRGSGKGPGVGLCLASSEELAQKKRTVEKILLTHFPGSEILNMRQETGRSSDLSPIWE